MGEYESHRTSEVKGKMRKLRERDRYGENCFNPID